MSGLTTRRVVFSQGLASSSSTKLVSARTCSPTAAQASLADKGAERWQPAATPLTWATFSGSSMPFKRLMCAFSRRLESYSLIFLRAMSAAGSTHACAYAAVVCQTHTRLVARFRG